MGLPYHKTIGRPNNPHDLITRTPSDVTPAGGRRVPITDEEQADTDEGQEDRGASNDIEGRANQNQE